MSSTFSTPAWPSAASPHRYARPIITARAPSASALTTSPPRRMPPSSSTSIWSPTASAIAGSARIVAGVPSRLLPPWLDTEIALTARVDRAPGVVDADDALEHERPVPLLAQPGDVVPGGRRGLHPLAVGAEERRCGRAGASHVRRGQLGQEAGRRIVAPATRGCSSDVGREPAHRLESSRSGMDGLPQSRAVRERPVERHDQPDGAGRAGPLACAAAISSREPIQYDLEERLAGWPPRPLRSACWRRSSVPSRCPRAAAARATATSPSGCTAWTPVGEMSTGSESVWPITVVARVALRRQPGDVRGEAELGERRRGCRCSVSPRSEPRDQRPVDRRAAADALGAALGLGDASRTSGGSPRPSPPAGSRRSPARGARAGVVLGRPRRGAIAGTRRQQRARRGRARTRGRARRAQAR